MRITDIFQMYTGWGINGLADVYHNDNFICSSTGIVMEKLPDKKKKKRSCLLKRWKMLWMLS